MGAYVVSGKIRAQETRIKNKHDSLNNLKVDSNDGKCLFGLY